MLPFEELINNANQHLWLLLDSWYVVIPICVFLIFAAKFVERVAVSLFGFLLGGFVVYPILYDRFEVFRNWVNDSQIAQYVAFFVIGIACAIALYVLFKVFVFLVGFFAAAGVVYYLADFLVKRFEILPKMNDFVQQNWFPILLGICAIFGVIAGLFAMRRSSSIIAILSLLAASIILAVEAIGWVYYLASKDVEKTVELFSTVYGLAVLIVICLVFFSFGIYLNFAKKRKKIEKNSD
ncbi:hypothetical protein ACSFC1_06965 [Pseudothermotoga sp. U03pept]|uniref:hypothetical protein n=1 Tax=Pseudothermotoga sp. U03pept TaxID=3447012 RepID=UPI003F017049